MSRRGWLFFIFVTVFWGISFLLIRVAVRQVDPGVLVFGRTLIVTALLFPLVVAQRHVQVLWANIKWIAIFGVVNMGLPWHFMAISEEHITSSLTSLLICSVPLLTVIGQRIRRTEERITARRLTGLAIGTVGVALLVGLSINGSSLEWIVLMLLLCIGYAIGPMILATKLRHVPGVAVVAGATSVVTLIWLPWSVLHWPHAVSGETWNCVVTLSVVCTAAAFLTYFELIKESGATKGTVVTYANTAVAVVLGIVFLHEPLTLSIAFGFPLVLVGSIFATSRAPLLSDDIRTLDLDDVIQK